jgi:hypothetical protein
LAQKYFKRLPLYRNYYTTASQAAVLLGADSNEFGKQRNHIHQLLNNSGLRLEGKKNKIYKCMGWRWN